MDSRDKFSPSGVVDPRLSSLSQPPPAACSLAVAFIHDLGAPARESMRRIQRSISPHQSALTLKGTEHASIATGEGWDGSDDRRVFR